MKKRMLSLALIAAVQLSVLGCGSNAKTDEVSKEVTESAPKEEAEVSVGAEEEVKTEDASAGTYKVAYFPNTMNNTFQVCIDETLKNGCEKFGWEYTCYDSDYDLNTQLNQMADAVTVGYDAVIVIPVDSAGIRDGLQNFKDAGVKIVNIDTAVADEDMEFVDLFITTDCYKAGVLLGQQCAADYPDGAKIAILDTPWNESACDRVDGFMEGLGTDPKYEIVAQQDGESALDASMKCAEDIITANPDVDVFFCVNGPSGLGVSSAAAAAGYQNGDIAIYCVDASPDDKAAFLDGQLKCLAAQVPIQEAEKALELLPKLLNGEKLDETEIYLDSHIVSKEEAEATVGSWQ